MEELLFLKTVQSVFVFDIGLHLIRFAFSAERLKLDFIIMNVDVK